MAFWVGVDGGGTGTRVRLQDAAGRTLGQGAAGPSSLSLGVPQAWRHVTAAVAAAFADAGLAVAPPQGIALGLGLAGAEVRALRAAFIAADPGHAALVIENDGITQLAGVHAGRPGVVVSAGTGAVAAARLPNGQIQRSGGWGWPVGDEGAGAWLGVRAVRALQHALDGRAAPGPLSAAVARALAGTGGTGSTGSDAGELGDIGDRSNVGHRSNAEAVRAWCAHAGQNACAQFAPLVFVAADAGDAHAEGLLQTAAAELARLATAFGAAAAGLPIVLNGSVGERLRTRWPAALQARCVEPAGDSADGALRLLRQALSTPGFAPDTPPGTLPGIAR